MRRYLTINHEYKFIFLHIPKTAGVSVGTTLYDLVGIDDLYDGFKIHHDIVSEKNLRDYFVFTFVRNPWDRMTSEYKFRHFLHNNYSFDYAVKNIHRIFEDYYKPPCKITGTGEMMNTTKDPNIIQMKENKEFADYYGEFIHLPSQLDFLRGRFSDQTDKIPFIDFIGRFENLQEDFNFICDKIGLKQTTLPRGNIYSDGNYIVDTSVCANTFECKTIRNRKYWELYDDETKLYFKQEYKEEIEYFNYKFLN